MMAAVIFFCGVVVHIMFKVLVLERNKENQMSYAQQGTHQDVQVGFRVLRDEPCSSWS